MVIRIHCFHIANVRKVQIIIIEDLLLLFVAVGGFLFLLLRILMVFLCFGLFSSSEPEPEADPEPEIDFNPLDSEFSDPSSEFSDSEAS